MNRKDWTREHYAPKSRVPYYIAQNPYNIRPALAIINHIKGNLFPCEWQDARLRLCYRALQNYHLKPAWRQQVRAAIANYESAPAADPCADCICRFYREYCPQNLRLDRGR